jgi:hypothetical protein
VIIKLLPGATALLAAVNQEVRDIGWYYLAVILLSSTLVFAVALIIDNIQRRYPVFWYSPAVPAHLRPPEDTLPSNSPNESAAGTRAPSLMVEPKIIASDASSVV